jgi:serine/threonine-protein kinase HipA
MNCLCCGKPIKETASEIEKTTQWHTRCVKKFFGTKTLPNIDLSEETIEMLATQSTNKGLTVTGVQKKLSLHLSNEDVKNPRLTLVNFPTGYILKPQTDEYPSLPEAEYLVMSLAEKTGIKTVPFALIKMPLQYNQFAYITKRVDRADNQILAMEDFCQLDGRLTEDKYKGSYERCGKIVSNYSSRVGIDISELFIRIVFSFIVGNSDMHLKNYSLIETAQGSTQYIISPAYDLLPVNVVNPQDTEEIALTLNGKKRNLHRNDFIKLAESFGISKSVADKLIDSVIKNEKMYIENVNNSYLNDDLKMNLIDLIQLRINALRKN